MSKQKSSPAGKEAYQPQHILSNGLSCLGVGGWYPILIWPGGYPIPVLAGDYPNLTLLRGYPSLSWQGVTKPCQDRGVPILTWPGYPPWEGAWDQWKYYGIEMDYLVENAWDQWKYYGTDACEYIIFPHPSNAVGNYVRLTTHSIVKSSFIARTNSNGPRKQVWAVLLTNVGVSLSVIGWVISTDQIGICSRCCVEFHYTWCCATEWCSPADHELITSSRGP